MATTVGATLASSKLAVTQDDLHLAGASVDQLTVQFNQLAFNDLLASDRRGQFKRRCSEDHQPAAGGVAPPSSATGGFRSPRATRIWRARTSADRERPLNKGLTPVARTLQEIEIEPLYKILLHNRKLRPLARPPPAHLTRHPKYCAYHQLVGHPTSKCRSLRERLEGIVRQGAVA